MNSTCIFHLIVRYVKRGDILNLSQVCKRFSFILKNSEKCNKYTVCGKCFEFETAVEKGHLGCINQFDNLSSKQRNYLPGYKNGHFHVFKWLFNKHERTNFIDAEYAFRNIKYHTKLLYTFINPPITILGPFERAVEFGNLEILQNEYDFLNPMLNGRYFLSENHCEIAVQNGHLNVLIFLREKKCPWNSNLYSEAIKNDYLECFIYLNNNNCPVNPNVNFIHTAIVNNSVKSLKYLVENRFPILEKSFLEDKYFDQNIFSQKSIITYLN